MTTFDEILTATVGVLNAHRDALEQIDWLVVNRDLNGRARFIAPEPVERQEEPRRQVERIYRELAERIAPHAYPPESGLLFEVSREAACSGATGFRLEDFTNVWLIDRLATEGNWAEIAPETQGPRRIVFFSIKGGVGRSTALAACAWRLAQAGKRVLVLDLDLESPGLSSSLLPPERQPKYGITDWLVEDLVENADTVFESMIATSDLAYDGEIYVAPAHGADPGEYVAKLGRVWMPKIQADGTRQSWSSRLHRLLQALEGRIRPDVVLIDSRAGIDEVASACVTDLGANLVLLFTLEGCQTWNGYRILFEHWRRAGVARQIRERLKSVAALVPEVDRIDYLKGLREGAYQVFADSLYDEIAPPPPDSIERKKEGEREMWRVWEIVEGWNFDEADEGAPHSPWVVHWHRSFAGLRSLQGRLAVIDAAEVNAIFGGLIEGVRGLLDSEINHD
ncbi:MAG: AAA family ATPase [Tepidimonas sp.]|uniref:ParA family protein n=1 Tax=Tepidimonas sp. TaxID=2002775 RepID=UPI00259E3B62|nr:ArsA-related P-loop ATPase [Tepidimonas sp.]MDM7457164.1 AAA family ATPase [Tepidimonas sp.]